MELKPNLHVQSDDAFKDKTANGVLSSRPHKLLSAEMNALAVSLDVTSPGNGDAYEPDAFLKAIQSRHDQLMEIKDRLHEQAVAQKKLAAQLSEREAAVAFREKRVLAHERLLGQTNGRRTLWGFFSKI